MPRPRLLIDWSSLPWSQKNDAALSRQLGCCAASVAKHRAIYAPGTEFKKGRPLPDLSKADFTMRDSDIAFVWDCDPNTVKRYREAHGKPACTLPRRKGTGRPPKYAVFLFDPSKSARWNADTLGCTHQNAWHMLNNYKNRNKQ